MAKEKVHCSKCGKRVLYEAKELKKPEVTCSVCGAATLIEARAVAKFVHTAPRKLRLIADAIRGKKVNEALTFLRFAPKRAAKVFSKVVESAKANAENTYKMDPENLVLTTVFVDSGPAFKRFMPRAMGRAAMVRKRMSHITVKVRERDGAVVVEKETKPTGRARTKRAPAAPKAETAKAKAPKAAKTPKEPKAKKTSAEKKQGDA